MFKLGIVRVIGNEGLKCRKGYGILRCIFIDVIVMCLGCYNIIDGNIVR